MPSPIASHLYSCGPAARASLRLGLITALLLLGCRSLQDAVADGDTRTISMHHLHSKEDITVTFKRNGRYDDAALQQLNRFLRDWRHDTETRMDPHLIDLVWEVYREVGGSQPILVIGGYRDESTNTMLRRRSSGVAENSLHMSGKAIDFAIPGVALDKLRAAGLRLQRGGVGFYPSSGSPFVHMDVGGVRHWPRMTREQLARIFPDGRTVHIPTNGQPLAGYALALADVERRGGSLGSISAGAAREAGIDTAAETTASVAPGRGLLARIFGAGEFAEEAAEAKGGAARAPARVAAKATPVPLPKLRPADAPIAVALAAPPPDPPGVHEKAAALAARAQPSAVVSAAPALPSPNDVILARGYWAGLPDVSPVSSTGSVDQRFAFAPVPERYAATIAPYYALPQTVAPQTVVMRSPATATSIAIKSAVVIPALPVLDPWLSAVTITPSVRTYLSSTQYGVRDPRSLGPFLDKPAAAVAMTFSVDPHKGLSADTFSGSAVVFVGTVAFAAANTADPTRVASLY